MVIKALTRTRLKGKMSLTDWLSYGFLFLGVVLMFGPALWLGASSLKTKTALQEFPPSFLPMGQKEVRVAGRDAALPIYLQAQPDGSSRELPDELIDAARMDGASEWRIYWRIIMPLAVPALAVLGIFSVMWRWNDFLWPLIVLNREEVFTLQLGLASFQGELDTQWHYLLAMTVMTLAPVVLVFLFLQKHITSGIASTGLK